MTYKIISKPGCPACTRAKARLTARGLEYEEDLRDTPEGVERFINDGHRTFPRVFWQGDLIGGDDQLKEFLAQKPQDGDEF